MYVSDQRLDLGKASAEDTEPVKGQIIISLLSRDGPCGGGTQLAVVSPLGELCGPTDNSNNELPTGWEERRTPLGRLYYVNHITKSTAWARPTSNNQILRVRERSCIELTRTPRNNNNRDGTNSLENSPSRRDSPHIRLSNIENLNRVNTSSSPDPVELGEQNGELGEQSDKNLTNGGQSSSSAGTSPESESANNNVIVCSPIQNCDNNAVNSIAPTTPSTHSTHSTPVTSPPKEVRRRSGDDNRATGGGSRRTRTPRNRPAAAFLSNVHVHSPGNPVGGPHAAKLDLPAGYELRTTQQGQVYFHHIPTGVSTWHDPRIPRDLAPQGLTLDQFGALPPGWERRKTPTGMFNFNFLVCFW